MNALQKTALIFTVIGAINWGLIGLFNFNLVDSLFGQNSFLSMLIYIVVGIAGLINIMLFFTDLNKRVAKLLYFKCGHMSIFSINFNTIFYHF